MTGREQIPINSYAAVDIETTGLDPRTDKIIEIGAVRVEGGRVTARMSTLVTPRRPLEARIVELTGIDDAMVAKAPGIESVIGELVDFCEGLPLLGHHVIFDYSFLKRAAVNVGLTFEKEGIDTLVLCRRFMPAQEKKNLASACRYYGIENAGAHRALSDAHAAHELYRKLLEQHGGEASFEECSAENVERMKAFGSKTLIYKVKKEQPATKRQKESLRELLKYHKIDITVQIDYLTRNEISRMTDKIISQYGRIRVKR